MNKEDFRIILAEKLREELAEITRANRAYKAEVSLATARSNASLIDEWGLTNKAPFFSLTIIRVGTGVFSIRTYFTATGYVEYTQDELSDGFIIDHQFIDLKMTNASQTVTNPKFLIDWRE
jgi:hypothetical protein